MNNKTLTSKQSSFVNALVASHGSDQTDLTGGVWYSRQQLLETANSLGMKYPPAWIVPVSYTHLTLPTIYSV